MVKPYKACQENVLENQKAYKDVTTAMPIKTDNDTLKDSAICLEGEADSSTQSSTYTGLSYFNFNPNSKTPMPLSNDKSTDCTPSMVVDGNGIKEYHLMATVKKEVKAIVIDMNVSKYNGNTLAKNPVLDISVDGMKIDNKTKTSTAFKHSVKDVGKYFTDQENQVQSTGIEDSSILFESPFSPIIGNDGLVKSCEEEVRAGLAFTLDGNTECLKKKDVSTAKVDLVTTATVGLAAIKYDGSEVETKGSYFKRS